MKNSIFKYLVFSLGLFSPSLSHAQHILYNLHKIDPIYMNTDTNEVQVEESSCGRPVNGEWYKNRLNGIRGGIGYSYQSFFEPVSPGINYMYGIQLSLDVFYKRLYLGVNGSYQSNLLQTDYFYYDKNKEYNWIKDKTVSTIPITLRTGLCFIQRNRFRMTTYAGIGNSRIKQETEFDEKHDNEMNTSVIKGTRAELGLSADLILYSLGYPFNGIELSANINGARTEYDYFGTTYSLNASIALHIIFRP